MKQPESGRDREKRKIAENKWKEERQKLELNKREGYVIFIKLNEAPEE